MTVQPAERVETDLSVIEALDFEESLPCENRDDCPDPARWHVVQTCCGHRAGVVCEPCRVGLAEYTRVLGWTKACRHCGAVAGEGAFRFEPIRP